MSGSDPKKDHHDEQRVLLLACREWRRGIDAKLKSSGVADARHLLTAVENDLYQSIVGDERKAGGISG